MLWLLSGLALYFLVLLAERALVDVSPHDIEHLKAIPKASAVRAVRLARDPRPALGALLLARVWLKILLVCWGGYKLLQPGRQHENPLFQALGGSQTLPAKLALVLALALAAALCFLLARKLSEAKWLRRYAARMLQALSGFSFAWLFLFGLFVRRLKSPATETTRRPETTPDGRPGFVAPEERDLDLLKSIVQFNDVTVKQVMQPRSRVVALNFRTDFHEVLQTVRDSGFSRIPVYDEDLDNVTGILFVKDLLEHLEQPADYEWQGLIRTNALLVPESKRISELLREFKSGKMHLAIAVDEYGGSSGIVTMEDILEEITGEIRDEFDEENEEAPFRKLDDFTFLFEGQAQLNDVCRITGLAPDTFEDARGNADTLAGLVLELKGDIPKTGAELAWNNFVFTVTLADNRRIKQIKLSLPR
jgi:CBS domain containing-hemolysin-like protein